MNSSEILTTYDKWEQMLKDIHASGKTVGLVSESNRMYRYKITYEDRVQLIKDNNIDIVAYIFIPKYQEYVGYEKDVIKDIYGKRYFDSIDDVVKNRGKKADFIFIPPYLKYKTIAKNWVYKNAPTMKLLPYIDSVQYIRGCFSVECYVSWFHKEKIDFMALCPWQLPYNLVCYELVNKMGITAKFAKGMSVQSIIEANDPVLWNPYNYEINYDEPLDLSEQFKYSSFYGNKKNLL